MLVMKHARFTLITAILLCLVAAGAYAQGGGKKEYSFKGKVEKVDATARTLTVFNENVPGWMGSMSMSYAVDKPEILKTLKVGDQITAKVYENDFKTLYGVQVVPPAKK